MSVNDRANLRTLPIDPQVKAVRRVGHALTFQHTQIVVDQQEVVSADLVQSEAEAHGPIGAGPVAAGCELSSKG